MSCTTTDSPRKKLLIWAPIFVLVFSLAGLLNQYVLLSSFGASLSDYADIDDFLVAAINLFQVIEFINWKSIISVLLMALGNFISHYLYQKKQKAKQNNSTTEEQIVVNLEDKQCNNKSAHKDEMFLIIFLTAGLFLVAWFTANEQANTIREGAICSVDVELNAMGKTIDIADSSELYPITGLNSAYFFYESTSMNKDGDKDNATKIESVHVIPFNNIAYIKSKCNQ